MLTNHVENLSALLDDLEAKFHEQLTKAASAAVESGEDLFVNSKFRPYRFNFAPYSLDAEELLEKAEACVNLREELGLEVVQSLGDLYLTACRVRLDCEEDGRSPQKLASALLDQLFARR